MLFCSAYACFCQTCMIAAAASGGADPPHPLKLVVVPVAHVIACERVWGQITDLQLGEVPDEVWIGHPEQRSTFLLKCYDHSFLACISFLTGPYELMLINHIRAILKKYKTVFTINVINSTLQSIWDRKRENWGLTRTLHLQPHGSTLICHLHWRGSIQWICFSKDPGINKS